MSNRFQPNKPNEFWSLVAVGASDDCWPWQGHLNSKGYGYLKWGVGRAAPSLGVHRIAYLLTFGELPAPPLVLRHSCDNRSCCNPSHLVPGTVAQNQADMADRDRSRFEDAHHWAKLNSVQVQKILRDLEAGVSRKALAIHFDVCIGTIGAIARGKTWRRTREKRA